MAAPEVRGPGGLLRPKVLFLTVVLLTLVFYTQRALALEWVTAAGRIGPGFFPRIVGVVGLALTVWALVVAVRSPQHDKDATPEGQEEEPGKTDLGHHPRLLLITVGALALLLVTLEPLGAIVSSALFLILMLTLINRQHTAANLVLSIGMPLGLYLLFDTALNAGLPSGVLPAF